MRLNRLLLPLLVVAAVVAWQALAPSQSPIGTQPAPEAQHDVSPSPVPSEAEAYADEVERALAERFPQVKDVVVHVEPAMGAPA